MAHLILLSHCCSRGLSIFKEVLANKSMNNRVTKEHRQVHNRVIPIMALIGLSARDVRLSPWIVECDDSGKPITWYKADKLSWQDRIKTK